MVCHSLASVKNLPSQNIFSLAGFHQTSSIKTYLLTCWLPSKIVHQKISSQLLASFNSVTSPHQGGQVKEEQLFSISSQSLRVCIHVHASRPSTQARHAEQKGTPDSDRNVCMCKTTTPRGAGGANRQHDVDEEGRGLRPGETWAGTGRAAPRRSPLEICLSAGCADPLTRQDPPPGSTWYESWYTGAADGV